MIDFICLFFCLDCVFSGPISATILGLFSHLSSVSCVSYITSMLSLYTLSLSLLSLTPCSSISSLSLSLLSLSPCSSISSLSLLSLSPLLLPSSSLYPQQYHLTVVKYQLVLQSFSFCTGHADQLHIQLVKKLKLKSETS